MARYLNAAAAEADGFTIVHEEDAHRFALYQRTEEGRTLIGEAHYTLGGSESAPSIDFDHTLVSPDFRGTGLSGILAHTAVTDDIVRDRTVHASCWFIDGYLGRHPELLTAIGATRAEAREN